MNDDYILIAEWDDPEVGHWAFYRVNPEKKIKDWFNKQIEDKNERN